MYTYIRPPSGASPCEAYGTIDATDDAFSFRYRGGHASITIESAAPVNSRSYEKRVSAPDATPVALADDLISHWIGMHLREQEIARAIGSIWTSCAIVEPLIPPADSSIISFNAIEAGNDTFGSFRTHSGIVSFHISSESLDGLLRQRLFVISASSVDAGVKGDTTFVKMTGAKWSVTFTFNPLPTES